MASDGILCSHVLAVCAKLNVTWDTYVSTYYKINHYEGTYAPQFVPIKYEAYWSRCDNAFRPVEGRKILENVVASQLDIEMEWMCRNEGRKCIAVYAKGKDMINELVQIGLLIVIWALLSLFSMCFM